MPSTLLIGAQGVLGTFIARSLAAGGWKVTRAGRRPEDAPDFQLLDLNDPAAVRRACGEADLIINTAHHPELTPERAVLAAGGTLIDLIELSATERQALREAERVPRGTVVLDTGLGGVAYLAIADLLQRNPGAEQAEYSLMVSASGSSGRAGALFAHSLLTDSAHKPTSKLPFPKPLGERRCIQVGDGPDGVLREEIAGVPIRSYLCMAPRPLHRFLLALNALRLIGFLPSASFAAGTAKVPSEPSEEPICEWVSVFADGRRLGGCTLEGSGYYRMTAAATHVFAEALSTSPAKERGLLSLEEVLTLDAVRPGLEEHGIAVRDIALD